MPGDAPPTERAGPRLLTLASVAALDAATLASLVWLASVVRADAWPAAVVLWLAVAYPAVPFLVLAWEPHRPPASTGAAPGSVTVVVCVDHAAPGEARTTVAGVAALGPCVAIGTDPVAVAAAAAAGVPVARGATLNEALSTAAHSIASDGVLILSEAAVPDIDSARRATGLLRDPAIGWITGAALPFNRDGYAPTVRQRLDRRLRNHCRASGAALWESDATVVRTHMLRDLPPAPDELWSTWLRRAGGHGWRGAVASELLAAQRIPVTAERYWHQAIRRQRAVAAGLADACRHGPWRARVRAGALLARSLYGWWLALALVAPAVLAIQGTFPFSSPSPLVAAVVGALGALRWAALRRVYGVPLRPARDLLAAAYAAPASVLSTPAALTGRVRSSRVALPPRPLGWIAGALAVPLAATVIERGGTPSHATAVAGALVVLLLLWSFAMQGIVQLLRARSTYRIPIDLAITVGGRPGRTSDAGPIGVAARMAGPVGQPGDVVPVTITLDDGRTLATDARIRHGGASGGHIVGLELQLADEQSTWWSAQLARTAVALTSGGRDSRATTSAAPEASRRAGRWIAAGLIGLVVAGVSSMLALPAFGLRSAVVVSPSMAPALQTGDLVIVRQLQARELAVGDIARIDLTGDGGTTHRVVAVDDRGDRLIVTTRGDANVTGELWELDPDVTVGAVELRVPWLGRVVSRVGAAVPREVVTLAVVVVSVTVVALAQAGRRVRR